MTNIYTKYIVIAFTLIVVAVLGFYVIFLNSSTEENTIAQEESLNMEENTPLVVEEQVDETVEVEKLDEIEIAIEPVNDTQEVTTQTNADTIIETTETTNTNVSNNFAEDGGSTIIGALPNIFVGKVIKEAEGYKLGSLAYWPIFEVEVISIIKGEAVGRVRIMQSNITVKYDGSGFSIDSDNSGISQRGEGDINDYLLQSGSTYTFPVRCDEGLNLCGGSDLVNSWKLITSDSTLSNSQLRALAENHPAVQQLKAEVKQYEEEEKKFDYFQN